MQIISGISEFQLNKPTAVAIGKFDGIHIGHRALIEKMQLEAEKRFLKTVIFTFSPSPESYFCGQALPELTTVSEKRRIFEKMGIDILIEFPMNASTASTDPKLFIEKYLRDQMRASYIVAGRDISFGDRGLGNAVLLEELSEEYNYRCDFIDKISYEGASISSTRIRDVISDGDMELAGAMLGSPYSIYGTVSHGRRLGRRMGMPTANVIIPPDKLIGPCGVYFSYVSAGGRQYPAISNVGVKPTVADDELLCVESYLYDFDEDIYGRNIEVKLLKFSRPEQKFESVDALKAQMEQDIATGRKYHEI